MSHELSIEILISTIGVEGIGRIQVSRLPIAPWLSYVVGCQLDFEHSTEIESCTQKLMFERKDISLSVFPGRGLSANRNVLISKAQGDIVIFADDDIEFDLDALAYIRDIFMADARIDAIKTQMFVDGRFIGRGKRRCLKGGGIRGEYAPAYALAIRRCSLEGLRFCELMGVGTEKYPSGEDDLFFYQLLQRVGSIEYVPIEMSKHIGISTGERIQTPELLRARGLVLAVVHRRTWMLRAAILAARVNASGWLNNFRNILSGGAAREDIREWL